MCLSFESQIFKLQKRRNDGQDRRIIAVEDWTLGKEKNVEKILSLKGKKIKKIFLRKLCTLKKVWENFEFENQKMW